MKLQRKRTTFENKLDKRGQIGGLNAVLLAFAFAGITYLIVTFVIGLGAKLNTDFSVGQTGAAAAVYGNSTLGYLTWAGYQPTVATVIIAVILIALLFVGFGALLRRGSM